MNKPHLRTYDDLLAEEKRLMQQIKGHETLLRHDIQSLKVHMRPVAKTVDFVHKLATRDHAGPLANIGLDFSIDLLVRKLILAKAGWFTKIVVPFVVKNYSSHIISDEHRAKLTARVQNLFAKFRPKKKKEGRPKTTDDTYVDPNLM